VHARNWLLSHGKGKTWGGNNAKEWGGQVHQIDISPQEADSNVRIDAPVVGDIGSCVGDASPRSAKLRQLRDRGLRRLPVAQRHRGRKTKNDSEDGEKRWRRVPRR
jgi:thiamine pyrophosphate-dependent acetolactate synthase large subunit-like protein